tara:strand:- start:2446 stop:7455 length:5010 start_codon:yes stop_codon:yes gene_type:complete
MGINKITPKGLSPDTDERLVKPGFMPDATNITLSEGGEGTESVLKNCKGTIPGSPFTSDDVIPNADSNIHVIGEVSDSQRGFIYFFVTGAAPKAFSSIYQYNTNTDEYRLVFSHRGLKFHPSLYITANVVNGAFQQNGVVQTILYFTDNYNPPRKINVDRALAGDYDSFIGSGFDYSLNTIKAAPLKAPTAFFSTTEELPHNNFQTTAFQFATQIIYVDGEESAISPYSKLTYSEKFSVHGIEEASSEEAVYTQVRLVVDNTCNISLNIDPDIRGCKDVSKIRLIAREGNTSVFYIIDEFDPNENLSRQVYGENINVYDSDSSEYKFFNDILGTAVPTATEDKLFDNVPLKARGQAVVGNRLMYSNYEEGRPNHQVLSDISVTYKDDTALKTQFVKEPFNPLNGFVDGNLGFTFRPLAEFAIEPDESTIIDAGSIVDISFNLKLDDVEIINADALSSEHIFEVDLRPNVWIGQGFLNEDPVDYFNGEGAFDFPILNPFYYNPLPTSAYTYKVSSFTPEESTSNGLDNSTPTSAGFQSWAHISISEVTPSEFTIDQFVEYLANVLSRVSFKQDYAGTFRLFPTEAANIQFQQDYQNNFPTGFENQNLPEARMRVSSNMESEKGDVGVEYKLVCEVNENNTIDVSVEVVDVKINNHEENTDSRFNPRISAVGDPVLVEGNAPGFGGLFDPTFNYDLFDFGLTYQSEGGLVQDSIINPTSGNGSTLKRNFDTDSFPNADTLFPTDFSVIDLSPIQGFKSGALHPLGIIYKDKWGRSSFVNKLGSAYVGWYNDHDRLKEGVFKSPGETILKGESFDGPASINIKFQSGPPAWAEAFQIVYPGNSLTDEFIQYSAVGAYVARKGDFESNAGSTFREIDTESKRIYVSFETLDIYRDQKNTVRDYSFTVGDKLRVKSSALQFSATATEPTDAYFSANDGSVIEFDVVGVELLTNDVTNPIAYNTTSPDDPHGQVDAMDKRFMGKFLVLEAPHIAGGAVSENGDQIKYGGFDWFSIAYENTIAGTAVQIPYPDGTVVEESLNHWQNQIIVEIYNPKKSTSTQFYYEIGETVIIDRRVNLDVVDYNTFHGPNLVLDTGDVHYRPVACKTADYRDEDGAGNTDGSFEFRWYVKDDWVYKTKLLEDFTPSDIISEKMWSKGRAHVEFKNAATVRRFNGLTYSDAYAEDVANLSLSSFNATLANFGSLESKYGAINYIYNYGSTGQLLALQENKFSLTAIDTNILLDVAGSENVALSTKVINATKYFVGDYGCGDHPEAVLVYDNDVFFVDVSRRKVLRISGGQMVPISDKAMSSTFNDIFKAWETSSNTLYPRSKTRKIISGYDPDEDTYYVTFYAERPLLNYVQDANDINGVGSGNDQFTDVYSEIQFNGYTLSYDVEAGYWQSKHSFIPTIYSNQNNTMYSCRYVRDNSDQGLTDQLTPLLFHKHDDLLDGNGEPINRTVFYNQDTAVSDFTVVSNPSPSSVKIYDALSYEGTSQPDKVSIRSSNGSGNDNIGGLTSSDNDIGQYQFVEKEDSFYITLPRDTSANSTSQFSGLGVCTDIGVNDGGEPFITIQGSLIGIPIPAGARLSFSNNGFAQPIGASETTVKRVEGNNIFVSLAPLEEIVDKDIILQYNSYFDGDSIRGHYATIKSNFKDSGLYEVYCVNAHVTNSPLHHASTN